MNKVTITPIDSFNKDAREVARFLRQEDRDELWALSRTLGTVAVRKSIEASTETYIAKVGDVPIAVFGVSTPALGAYGVPWFLGTRDVDRHAREYLTHARAFIAHLTEQCDTLENIASADNRKTLAFLSRLGFVISEPFKMPTGANAVRFVIRKT